MPAVSPTHRKIALVVILAAVIKLSWELEMDRRFEEHRGGNVGLTIQLRAKLGQDLAVALLSGFRGIVADFVWIGAHTAWEEQVWYKMKEGIELAVILQPRSVPYWDIGAWHFAWNASYAESVNPKYPSDAFRHQKQQEWIREGRRFLEEGIRNNPDMYDLYFRLGWLIYQKEEKPLDAVPFFKKAATYKEAPLYVRRMVGRMYEKAGEKKQEYEWWKKLWLENHSDHPDELWNKIGQWGAECEETLKMPKAERAFPPLPPKRPPPPPPVRPGPPMPPGQPGARPPLPPGAMPPPAPAASTNAPPARPSPAQRSFPSSGKSSKAANPR